MQLKKGDDSTQLELPYLSINSTESDQSKFDEAVQIFSEDLYFFWYVPIFKRNLWKPLMTMFTVAQPSREGSILRKKKYFSDYIVENKLFNRLLNQARMSWVAC